MVAGGLKKADLQRQRSDFTWILWAAASSL